MPTTITSTGVTTTNVDTTNLKNLTVPTASGTLVGSGANYPLNIDANATNESLKIDSNGYLTQPNTIFVHGQGMIPSYSDGVTCRWSVVINDGNCYDSSNGRFTAPVAGTYMFGIQSIASTATSILRWYPFKNGAAYTGIATATLQFRQETTSGDYQQNGTYNLAIPLAENDYVHFTANGGSSVYGFNDPDNVYHNYYVQLIK